MSQLVVLNLGKGNWHQGFPTVIAQLWERDNPIPIQFTGSLPPDPELSQLYQQWRSLYKALYDPFSFCRSQPNPAIEFDEKDFTSISDAEFKNLSAQLQHQLNLWLKSDSFRNIELNLRTRLMPSSVIQVLIATEDEQVRRLPWHLWNFFEDYPLSEVALSTQNYESVGTSLQKNTGKVRILAILGNSKGIEVQKDRAVLEKLADTETVFLVEPQRQELDNCLWDEQGWDILFFAGHSSSEADFAKGKIEINPHETITIPQLKNALKTAIANGLQLGIFNSCDSLGLAQELADLQIPQLIVMREKVPDVVAQKFLKHLVATFSSGQSLSISVRKARERLQGMERECPCASWLPVICQNPAARPPTWEKLRGDRRKKPRNTPDVVTIVFTDLVNSGAIKQHSDSRDYSETILKPYHERVQTTLITYQGRVVKSEGDTHLLVFANALQAIKWAVDLQTSCKTKPIPTPLGELQIRIGMHTGSPLHNGSDFQGEEIDWGTQIYALAKVGQILLSEVTADLLRHANLTGLRLHCHGDRYLKDIGAVPIFELLYADKACRRRSTSQSIPQF
ncbi:MAG: CHAT domain-containing protein [Moorea sp. SIO2B7]|nr:CHAT domain-containing protein [Moorena sp. SIO2B7]